MNDDDLNLHSMTNLAGWLRYCATRLQTKNSKFKTKLCQISNRDSVLPTSFFCEVLHLLVMSLRIEKNTSLSKDNYICKIILPLPLKSSTNTISLSIDGGDLFKTLLTVRISVDHPSLWKIITTDAFNNFL